MFELSRAAVGRKSLPASRRHTHITWVRLDSDLRSWVEAKARRERLAFSDVLRQIVARAMECAKEAKNPKYPKLSEAIKAGSKKLSQAFGKFF